MGSCEEVDVEIRAGTQRKIGAVVYLRRMRLSARINAGIEPSIAEKLTEGRDRALEFGHQETVRQEAPDRVVIGFLGPQIMVNLVGKPEVKIVVDAAAERLRKPWRQCNSDPPDA